MPQTSGMTYEELRVLRDRQLKSERQHHFVISHPTKFQKFFFNPNHAFITNLTIMMTFSGLAIVSLPFTKPESMHTFFTWLSLVFLVCFAISAGIMLYQTTSGICYQNLIPYNRSISKTKRKFKYVKERNILSDEEYDEFVKNFVFCDLAKAKTYFYIFPELNSSDFKYWMKLCKKDTDGLNKGNYYEDLYNYLLNINKLMLDKVLQPYFTNTLNNIEYN